MANVAEILFHGRRCEQIRPASAGKRLREIGLGNANAPHLA